MSELIGFVGISHSPFATLLPPDGADQPGARFLADAARMADAVAALAPDAVVVIGPDHFHTNFYDVMPPFIIGVEETMGFGDYGSTAGPIPVASELAWAVRHGVCEAGFDLSLSYALTIDHGIVQGYELAVPARDVPIVPIVVNTAAPPLPSLPRCTDLGLALGAALRTADAGRVLVLASGGLSHWLPSNDPRDPTIDRERRSALIHGRRDTATFAAAREPGVRAMGGNPDAPVNEDWDRWLLDRFAEPDLAAVVDLGSEGIEIAGGTGAHEMRAWLIGAAAVGRAACWTSYEAVPEWITGMGIATTFAVP